MGGLFVDKWLDGLMVRSVDGWMVWLDKWLGG